MVSLSPSGRLGASSPSDETTAFLCFSRDSRAIRAFLNTSPIVFPNFSSISRRSCVLSSSVMAATRLSFSSLICTRQSSVSSSSGGLSAFVLDACCTAGGTEARDGSVAGCCWASRFRAKTLFDLCCAVGNPVFDSVACGAEGAEAAGSGSARSRAYEESEKGGECSQCPRAPVKKLKVNVQSEGTWCSWFITLA